MWIPNFPVEEWSWYYGLSTIAQTCGAILALGGTFVLFQLSRLQGAIDNYRGRILDILYIWHDGKKLPFNYYAVENEDLLIEFDKMSAASQPHFYDSGAMRELYTDRERITGVFIDAGGGRHLQRISAPVDQVKAWCGSMRKLLADNLAIRRYIFKALRLSLIFLSVSIITSVGALAMKPNHWGWLYLLILVFSCFSIGFTAVSVWRIARSKVVT